MSLCADEILLRQPHVSFEHKDSVMRLLLTASCYCLNSPKPAFRPRSVSAALPQSSHMRIRHREKRIFLFLFYGWIFGDEGFISAEWQQ
jgi:hypothetical protein